VSAGGGRAVPARARAAAAPLPAPRACSSRSCSWRPCRSRAFLFELDRPLDARPGASRRVLQIEIGRGAHDLADIVDDLAARHARRHMPLDLPGLGRGQRSISVCVQRVFIRVHVTTLA
jgi:hypothetical protein